MPRNPKLKRYPARRIVRLHMAENVPSIEGVLVGTFDDRYVLEAGKVLESTESTVSVGPIEVERARVLFLQVMSTEGYA